MDGVEGVFVDRLEGLSRRGGRLWLTRPGEVEPVAVTARWLRPLTERREIAFLDEKQREVSCVRGLDALEGEGRALVERELAERYHLVEIRKVERIDVQFGTRYWHVESDRGPRWFALREPGKNVTWLEGGRVVLRDTAGNRYEIPDVGALDARSRRWVARSL
jgi:hypothetical protein